MKSRLASCVRSPVFWPTGVGIIAVLFAAFLGIFAPQGAGKVEAYTIDSDGRLMINLSQVQVSLNCYEASYNNLFGIYSPSPLPPDPASPRPLFHCKDLPTPTNVAIGTFSAGELVFYITNDPGDTWYTGPASRNVDNFQHAHLTRISDTVVRIGWEDLYGGGDQDFNDCVIDVTIHELPTATPTATFTPVPTSTFTPVPTNTFTPTATKTSTPTNTPVPPTATLTVVAPPPTTTPTSGHPHGVGGIVKLPPSAITAESGSPAGDSSWPVAAYAALAGGVAGAAAAVALGGWYARRRSLR